MRTPSILLFISVLLPAWAEPPKMPMPVDFTRTTTHRWLNKPVHESRLLDDMENPATWAFEGTGEMSFTAERAKDGKQSVRIRSNTRGTKEPTTAGRPFGAASAVRRVESEDWTKFNRLSVWVYPDLPGFRVVSLQLGLRNEGPEKGRTIHYVVLRNHEWNQVVWEIPDLARDKVKGVVLTYRQQGNEPDSTEAVTFDFDRFELQRVDPDHQEGWNVAPGLISFSHTGYQTGSAKRAFASGLNAREFRLISNDTGETLLTKPVQSVKSRIGEFQVLDFSEINRPGTYSLAAGGHVTPTFRIDDNVWRDTVWKAINFFYVERCGYEIPGVHMVCHKDWQGKHGDRRMIINGGWHDAGDLSQGLVNTSETVYAMFALAERIRSTDRELSDRLIEEAKWGLDWVLNTTFGDGYRVQWATMDYWSNGIIGDLDDSIFEARNSPFENFLASASEAIGARVLAGVDSARSSFALRRAKEDWEFGVAGIGALQKPSTDRRRGGSLLESASAGVTASLDLYRLTGERKYAEKAVELARIIVDSQQRAFLPGVTQPFAGFFYHSPDKTRMVHYIHRGHEQQPIVALAQLCEALPEHPDWMKWYSAVALHADYFQKQMATFTEPYRHLPNAIYSPAEAERSPAQAQANVREQILNGWKLSDQYYLRAYPVQPAPSFRGNFGTMLSQSKAISSAAHLRGNRDLAGLAHDQLHWVVGRNPFVQSTMWGEGYDYAPQYTAMSGDIVGSLPVGIKMFGNRDLPYWPPTNAWNYKEVWVHPVSRWFFLMQDLMGPATVNGTVAPNTGGPVMFKDTRTGAALAIHPDYASGRFTGAVPEGVYQVTQGGQTRRLTVLPGGTYALDMRPEAALDTAITSTTAADGSVTVTVTARGQGRHRFALRADNVRFTGPAREVTLNGSGEQKLSWQGRMISTDSPWLAVVIPDGDLTRKLEAGGDTRARR